MSEPIVYKTIEEMLAFTRGNVTTYPLTEVKEEEKPKKAAKKKVKKSEDPAV